MGEALMIAWTGQCEASGTRFSPETASATDRTGRPTATRPRGARPLAHRPALGSPVLEALEDQLRLKERERIMSSSG
jgi:hypothetical protein